MVYVAFLKGINVGRHNRIKMVDLKRLFESLGLKSVKTYIQSGNVLFKSVKNEEDLCKLIEREIMIIFRYVVPVVLRTASELEQIIVNCPYSTAEILEAESSLVGESLYVAFLKQKPSLKKVDNLTNYTDGDEFVIIDRDVYLLFSHHNFRNSKLARNLQNVDIHVTVRNWRTINKLRLMSKELEKLN